MNQIPNIEETHNTREVEEWEREFVEEGAALEHERWAGWQAYLHSKCFTNAEFYGALIIPADLVARWQRQIYTPYADLSEAEKESDRREARTYLPLIHRQLQKAREEERGRVVDEIAYAFSKHRDYELSELHRSDNRKETKEYIAKGIEVFYLEFLRRLDILKAQNHSELDQDLAPIEIPVKGLKIDCKEHGANQIVIKNGAGWCPVCLDQDNI